jgi:hypothetical protein
MRKEIMSSKVNIEKYFEDFCGEDDSVIETPEVKITPHESEGYLRIFKQSKTENVLKDYRKNGAASLMIKEINRDQFEREKKAIFELSQQIFDNTSVENNEDDLAMINLEPEQGGKPRNMQWLIKIAAISVLISAALDVFPMVMIACNAANTCNQIQTMALSQINRVTEIVKRQSISLDDAHNTELIFSSAINYAYKAAELTQTATTTQDWQTVEKYWLKSIQALEQIPEDSDLIEKVNTRLELYQKNRLYARGEFDTFREAVNAAEEASSMVKIANSAEEWNLAVETWREALELMNMVSRNSPNYALAQEKLAEYALKFAYTQNKYLDSVDISLVTPSDLP